MSELKPHSLSELARLGFEHLADTIPKLDELVSLVGDSGHSALAALSRSPSPDRALDAILELARKAPTSLVKALRNPRASERLCSILGASDGLASFLLRHPEELSFALKAPVLPSAQEFAALPSESVTALRVGYRRLLLRIADFDLSQHDFDAVGEITAALSDLAAGAISAGLVLARAELETEGRYSGADISATKLSVIAMGKCGARELNYLSDVDVIYVAGGDAENYLEIATRLATKLAKLIDEPDIEPGLWQIDPNLRPEGKQGALVRSLDAHFSYYERWAESWEFQALLKARFIAGDSDLGEQYISRIKPLIWSRPDRAAIVESARHLRKRVLDLIPQSERELEIKLGRGGLRDVEFTVQLMQLVHGTSDESLRVMDTFSALDALANSGLLSRIDRDRFRENYKFLRSLEHRVQLSKLRRTHLLPTDESELRRVARAMGMTSPELLEKWQAVRADTAALHDSVFYRPLLQATASLDPNEVQLSDEEVRIRLSALGFIDPVGAANHIAALTQGVSRRAQIQRTLLPVLIRWMAEGTDPDRAMLSFRRLSESLGETHWFLRMLRDSSGAAERLMRSLSSSALISRLLERIPDSSKWFGDAESLNPLAAELIESEMLAIIERRGQAPEELVRNIRRREYLRIAIGAVLGALSMEQVSKGLSDITEAYLRAMLELAKQRLGTELDFCIIAMGRLGGAELGFGSDADAMFLYQADTEGAAAIAEKLASELLVLVRDSLLEFEIDLDLRPEGKNGARVRTLAGYLGYYEKWADAWEFQALLRARPISGSQELRDQFEEIINPFRYPEQLSPKQLVEIRRIKARVESERLPLGADPLRHLKLGRGSLSDVEWVAQLYQLRFAAHYPQLQVVSTTAALNSLSELGLAPIEELATLGAAWRLASRCRSALVLAVDKLLDVLPADRRQLEAMARILDYPPGEATRLEEDYLGTTRKARLAFERLFLAN